MSNTTYRNLLCPESGKVTALVGGQFGSEGKGLIAAYIASRIGDELPYALYCTTNAGAQAGHTTVFEDGRKLVLFHLPTIGVLRPESIIYLNAGSIIDPYMLWHETVNAAKIMGEPLSHLQNRIFIHPRAAVIYDEHKRTEATATQHVGSTQKGVGAALTSKIMRNPTSVAARCPAIFDRFQVQTIDLADLMQCGVAVTMEVPQGTGLSLNAAPFYPKCTSRDCWVGQGLTDAAIHPMFLGTTAMVVRTHPIRVGNITDNEGRVLGHSGNFYPDSKELSWDELPGVTPELTTVTKRQRRIATWSDQQFKDACSLNRPKVVFVTFTNYLAKFDDYPSPRDVVTFNFIHRLRRIWPDALYYHSWGPRIDQVECWG